MKKWLLILAVALVAPYAASQFRSPNVPFSNTPYNGLFTFIRLRFEPSVWHRGGYEWGLDLKWNHDYPRGERNFTMMLDAMTTLGINTGGGNILSLNDPDLFKYPWAYICEVGFWTQSDEEAASLRDYLLKGGFLVVDDFILQAHWDNFAYEMTRVLPGAKLVELDVTHPIFDAFFRIETLDFEHPQQPWLKPVYYGIFEDNDPEKRLMVIANYNHDIGDYWEWSDQGWIPIELSNEAYKLGINYVIYGMTH